MTPSMTRAMPVCDQNGCVDCKKQGLSVETSIFLHIFDSSNNCIMILYYDCFSGISGDMNLAAMIDLGVPVDHLKTELDKLKLDGYSLEVGPAERNGIVGTQVKVRLDDGPTHHHHRNLADIVKIIDASSLNANVRKISIRMFERLAEAEARVHGKEIDEVHFHEVGAVDSIVDMVGAAICFDYLKPEKIYSSPVELGSGMIKCAHGIFPVPAPATAEILKGIPVKTGAQPFEATTPTGAVILASQVDEFVDKTSFIIKETAYGIGHKKSDTPNVLRVFSMENVIEGEADQHYMLDCNIDDMSPEQISYIMDKLFALGSDDVFITPIIMKKSRNASKLSVLFHESKLKEIKETIIKETSSFGFRVYPVVKTELEREFKELQTKYGVVRVKMAYHEGNMIKQKPEFEDCARIAREHDISISEVYAFIGKLLND